ncbi:hypothetical protein CDD82_4842 [Ophiocordyceps australis]|uniref:Vacuolar ATPase assembly protein VMA22 n=1 Tax=Ophiocordyceps australis TaxID=1399860 RepID=A0A2C5Z3R7_9HYPO|nr:hypothetical protein CDD82_4842 [Ophiocordyceps australis]
MSLQQQQQTIDEALTKYLDCLDRYALLRESLADLQAQTFGSIARANFTADRGVRHGQEYYDGRMRASRMLHICVPCQDGPPVYSMTSAVAAQEGDGSHEAVHDPCDQRDRTDWHSQAPELTHQDERLQDERLEEKQQQEADETTLPQHNLDPLRWFGILTPQALHQAQSTSVHVVERLLPQLASVVAEMRHLEAAVRRARKVRAKMMKQASHPSAEEESRAEAPANDQRQPRGADEAALKI